jgi:hypothetical protein
VVGVDDEGVVAEPKCSCQRDGRKTKTQEGAEAVSGASPEEPGDGGKEKDSGGLGEDHEREEKTKCEKREGAAQA